MYRETVGEVNMEYMPSKVRLSSDVNDFTSKLKDCSSLERVL